MIYVDDAWIPATVHSTRGEWSHLVAIPFNESELLEFGKRLGLKASWLHFGTCSAASCTHFDVTSAVREEAIRLGATPVTARQLCELIRAEKAQHHA
jgi:hypothetical protein